MRECSKSRAGFDRVLMAVAATFLTVSGPLALAQADPARNSAADLAIDAAIPRPEPANLPPPTIDDFKLDTTASVPNAPGTDAPNATEPKTTEKTTEKPAETKPAELVTAPAADTNKNDSKNDTGKSDTATTPTAPPPEAVTATPTPEPAKEPTKAARNLPPADQPVADKLREMLATKSVR